MRGDLGFSDLGYKNHDDSKELDSPYLFAAMRDVLSVCSLEMVAQDSPPHSAHRAPKGASDRNITIMKRTIVRLSLQV